MPEPDSLKIEHLTLTSKKVSWDYELDRFDGFKLRTKYDDDWSEPINVDAETRSYIYNDVPVNEDLQYKIVAFADENYIKIVLRNLVTNAIKFADNEGEIKISAKFLSMHIEITVADSGIGLLKDDIEKLF